MEMVGRWSGGDLMHPNDRLDGLARVAGVIITLSSHTKEVKIGYQARRNEIDIDGGGCEGCPKKLGVQECKYFEGTFELSMNYY